jgi:hypothetical protein
MLLYAYFAVKPVKLTDQNAFSTTYYHLGPECIAEREGPTRQVNIDSDRQ